MLDQGNKVSLEFIKMEALSCDIGFNALVRTLGDTTDTLLG